jgi:hypothetical protein
MAITDLSLELGMPGLLTETKKMPAVYARDVVWKSEFINMATKPVLEVPTVKFGTNQYVTKGK